MCVWGGGLWNWTPQYNYGNFQVYLYRDCDIDAVDSLHHTPLHIAARRNHTSAVRILLEKGADMQLKDDNGEQPIHIAAEAGNYEYVTT